MDDLRYTAVEEALHALGASNDALRAAVSPLQAEVAILNAKFDFFVENYARKADVETIRTEIYKAMDAQTWKLITWMTVVCSGLATVVYFIARNVH